MDNLGNKLLYSDPSNFAGEWGIELGEGEWGIELGDFSEEIFYSKMTGGLRWQDVDMVWDQKINIASQFDFSDFLDAVISQIK